MMDSSAVITVATTGPIATTADNPTLPTTPEEIAQAVAEAYDEGAAVAHIHLREQIIDIGAGHVRGADNGHLARQRMAAADTIHLQLVTGTHDLDENLIALRRIGRKIGGQEVGTARCAAAHQNARDGACGHGWCLP